MHEQEYPNHPEEDKLLISGTRVQKNVRERRTAARLVHASRDFAVNYWCGQKWRRSFCKRCLNKTK